MDESVLQSIIEWEQLKKINRDINDQCLQWAAQQAKKVNAGRTQRCKKIKIIKIHIGGK